MRLTKVKPESKIGMNRYQDRRDRLRKALERRPCLPLLVTNFTNVTYLTGFTGDDSYLVVLPKDEIVISDPRYTTQLEEECPEVERYIRPPGRVNVQAIEKVLKQAKLSRLGIEGDSMTVGTRERLAEKVDRTSSSSPPPGSSRNCGCAKTKTRSPKSAARSIIAAKGVHRRPQSSQARANGKRGRRCAGASDAAASAPRAASFPPIVAVGDRAALPHYRPGGRRIGDAPSC